MIRTHDYTISVCYNNIKITFFIVFSLYIRYYYLAFRAHEMPETSKENAVAILERAKLEDWVLGTTKVISKKI